MPRKARPIPRDKRLQALYRRARGTLLAYQESRHRLRRMGVIRTDGPVVRQFAEQLVARHLRLRLAKSNVQGAYDAKDSAGRTHQIKARIGSTSATSTSFDFRRPLSRFGFLCGVLLTRSFARPMRRFGGTVAPTETGTAVGGRDDRAKRHDLTYCTLRRLGHLAHAGDSEGQDAGSAGQRRD